MFKKGIYLLGLCASVVSYAASYQACQSASNQVPCNTNQWVFSGEALYLRNQGGDLSDLLDNLASVPTGFKPDFAWGFNIEGIYRFGTGKDTSVEWLSYDASTRYSSPSGFLFSGNGPGSTLVPVNSIMRFSSKFNIVNWDFGQSLIFGEVIKTRPHVGLEWAELKENVGHNVVALGGLRLANDSDARKLTGWGARAGWDGEYNFLKSFSLFTTNGLGLLWMSTYQLRTSASLQSAWPDLGFNPLNNIIFTRSKIVPETDIDIGIKYHYPAWEGELTAKAAWDQRAYLGAGYRGGNWSWGGLAFGLSWVGNA